MRLTFKASVLFCIQNVTHVPQAARGELVAVLLNLVGGLREHQEPSFAISDLQASTFRTFIVLPQTKHKVKCKRYRCTC